MVSQWAGEETDIPLYQTQGALLALFLPLPLCWADVLNLHEMMDASLFFKMKHSKHIETSTVHVH